MTDAIDEKALRDTLESMLSAYEELVGRVETLESSARRDRPLDREELPDWVEWLRSDYALGTKIPDDWSDIPGVRHELEALWAAWEGSYDDNRDPSPGFDTVQWHDALHRVISRIREVWMPEERTRSLDRGGHGQVARTQPLPVRRAPSNDST